ncbi:prepilin-type N-terminal cleavage/methylation domain-containing protein [Vibrio sp. Vb2110]|uniref:type IV pilus modification PilV family protein n=1 Tax=Vibrio TaxID=662 RepID=UPI001428572F|nr:MULTISPECIES: prepilin-type N-terminal cleavage/methylation domain-containing protein [unclassified Vibrio]EGR0266680.1 prepilin-type N-terminal cleavage/methylation domain-containing protein [Vibrio alginolyticus]QIR89676.1 prepilin-type N-terminal cleavage/methylation domain-containing protein [Vibrio diabolicus]EKM3679782.1 prepilin-type N-terminal cleavage/methylation domain-containing protein [Vibrio alginolyticus]MDW1847907.1 prepilin-type N-terminal cleavage/methylation domain-contain
MKKSSGMTLIEMIIAIVLMGIAMVAFTSFLVPQIRDSAIPHYQTRAAALGQGFMSQILARGFDENSDFDGGTVRCGENGVSCTDVNKLGADKKLDGSLETTPSDFNDVDDYIGCWYTKSTKAKCNSSPLYELSNVLGTSMANDYKNFRVEVKVQYVESDGTGVNNPSLEDITAYKRVTMTIYAGQTQPLTLSAIRGNY